MWLDLAPTELLSVASFSLALAGLLVRFIVPTPTAREHLASAALVFMVLALGLTTFHSARRAHDITQLGERIVVTLGNSEKTFDQVLAEVGYPELRLLSAAFESLAASGRLETRLETVRLTQRQSVQVRLWRVVPSRDKSAQQAVPPAVGLASFGRSARRR